MILDVEWLKMYVEFLKDLAEKHPEIAKEITEEIEKYELEIARR